MQFVAAIIVGLLAFGGLAYVVLDYISTPKQQPQGTMSQPFRPVR
jgi:hypothetical protein